MTVNGTYLSGLLVLLVKWAYVYSDRRDDVALYTVMVIMLLTCKLRHTFIAFIAFMSTDVFWLPHKCRRELFEFEF